MTFRLSALLLGLLLAACSPDTYDTRGRIVGFGDDNVTVFIEHEAIPDFMPAMTMPFVAERPALLDEVAYGDAVAVTFEVEGQQTRLTALATLPDDAVPASPAAGSMTDLPRTGQQLLEPGDAPPQVQLVDQDADTLQLGDFQGEAVLVTFIYTRCPLPDYCPLMSSQFQQLQRALLPRFGGDDVQLVSVSFDPDYDTPEVLRDYAQRYTEAAADWSFVTGTPEAVSRLADAFGVFYANEAQPDEFIHNLTTALLTPEGHVARIWRGNDWTVEEVEEAVAEVLPPGA